MYDRSSPGNLKPQNNLWNKICLINPKIIINLKFIFIRQTVTREVATVWMKLVAIRV